MKSIVFFGELLLRLGAPNRELLFQTPRLDVCVGGAEANVAIGLANLGHRCRMVSVVSDDALGRAAIAAVRAQNVNCESVSRVKGRMGLYFLETGATGRSSQIIYDRSGSAFAIAKPEQVDWHRELQDAGHFHVSGITCALGSAPASMALDAVETARSLGVSVSFDVNYRAKLWESRESESGRILFNMVNSADVLFGNRADISKILKINFPESDQDSEQRAVEAAFSAFPNLGCIASTKREILGSDDHRLEARVDTRSSTYRSKQYSVNGIVDRIGAGDAFAAGFLDRWLFGDSTERAAEIGVALAAMKHSLFGDASLFSRADLEVFMNDVRDVRR